MRIVAKIGTSSLTDERGVIHRGAITSICEQTAALRHDGHEVLLVSSGAVSAGVAALGLSKRPTDMPTLQALAALGQPRLMEVYNAELGRHGVVAAQVLVVPPDFVNRRQYLHARQTLTRLLDLGCVPIVNENDAIASDEIRWGDNDRIAALLANLVRADLLVLLTDTDGLFTADPRVDPAAQLIERVAADDPMLSVNAGRSASNRGSGGMASKLTAARIACWSGVEAVIARSTRPNVIVEAVAGVRGVGTVFEAHDRHLTARKLWIAFSSTVAGTVHIDDGARSALVERNTSLLPAGVTGIGGGFDEGDTIEIIGSDGVVIARGMAAMNATTARRVAGRRTADVPSDVAGEVVHRDDLVLVLGAS